MLITVFQFLKTAKSSKCKQMAFFIVHKNLINTFVFPVVIAESLSFVNIKCQASVRLLKPVQPGLCPTWFPKHYENMPMQYTDVFQGCKN